MSVSKEAFQETNTRLREACNDLICAVKENPHVFKNVEVVKHYRPKPKPLPSSYRHLGIIGVAIAGVAKFIGLGLH